MKKNIIFNTVLILTVSFFVLSFNCLAATYYISPNGSNASNGLSDSKPWKTFAHAFSEMNGGDTLWLMDGVYSLATNTGAITFDNSGQGESAQPPSGINKTNMTIVRAVNDGLAIIDGKGEYENAAIFIGRTSRADKYIKIQGIKALTNVQLFNADYCMLKDSGVRGGIHIGSNDHKDSSDYNLIEDCWMWAVDERIISSMYEGKYNIWRRVVVRGDGCNTIDCKGSGNPNVGVTIYNSHHSQMQNVISINRVLNGGEPYADFATAQHSGGANDYKNSDNKWLGCMSINSEDTAFYLEADNYASPTVYLENTLVMDVDWGIAINDASGASIINATLLGNNKGAWIDWGPTGQTTRNIVIRGNANRAFVNTTGDYINAYGSWGTEKLSNSKLTNEIVTDPYNDAGPSILYPIRIEQDSTLSGSGYGGADIGANITKRYGIDGAFHGDPGYETLSDVDLWPWPNENRIKNDMKEEYSSKVTETRGFCSNTDNPRTNTGKMTLTSYIWEYLGNEIPADLYKTSGNNIGEKPGAVILKIEDNILPWTQASGNIVGYKVYYGESSGIYTESISAGNVLQISLSALPLNEGTTYYLNVRAYNNFGEGPLSNEIIWTNNSDHTPPMAPTDLKIID